MPRLSGPHRRRLSNPRALPDTKDNRGDPLTAILACAGIPLDRPVGIATKQLKEMMTSVG